MTRLLAVLPGLVFTGISLLLFAYVAFGEANLVYSKMRNEKLVQLGTTLQFPINQFARSGLELDQLAGFGRRASLLFDGDPAIQTVQLLDRSGRTIGCVVAPDAENLGPACKRALETLTDTTDLAQCQTNVLTLSPDAALHPVCLQLSDKFEEVGSLVLWIHSETAKIPVKEAFMPVLWIAPGLFVVFALVQLLISGRGAAAVQRALTPSFLTVLALVIALLGTVMFDLYRRGTEGQAEATAMSLASRIEGATDLGIPLDRLSGIPEMLDDYVNINPNIAALSITSDGELLYMLESMQHDAGDSDDQRTRNLVFDHTINGGQTNLVVTAELPFSVVLDALASGARNFVVLFFGCYLFSNVLLGAVRKSVLSGATPTMKLEPPTATARLALLQPAYFIGVFADALVISILPEISGETVANEGLSKDLVSLPFSLFFVGLTLALIPASMLADRMDLRRLLMIGGGLVAVGLFMVGAVDEFWALCTGRAIGGIGQGVMLIAMQSYAFELVDANNRIKASVSQVLGYNGGLIAGTGIGGLLASFHNNHSVVLLAGAVGLSAIVYTYSALPSLRKVAAAGQPKRPASLFSDVRRVLLLPDFLGVLLLAGVTSKFALAGVAMFAMPLVLHQAGYANNEVGQALMVFAGVTYLVTIATPRIVLWLKSTDRTLLFGLFSLAIGMGLFGLSINTLGNPTTLWTPSWLSEVGKDVSKALEGSGVPAANGLSIAVAISLLGVGQGMIAAPIVARIASGPAAELVGRDRAVAVYRILERGGHILGPALCGGLLVAAGGNPLALTSLGMIYLLICGAYGLMLVVIRRNSPQQPLQ